MSDYFHKLVQKLCLISTSQYDKEDGCQPHIVDYITSQGWDGQEVEIFMGLKGGTLESIIESGDGLPMSIADSLFPQMLQALDCLAYNGIVHRDVKPENI